MGKDKGFCLLNKKPLIRYAIDTLSNVCDSIIIGANNGNYSSLGYSVVGDEIADIGPIGGIYSCLKASKTNHNFILSCDMPMVSEEQIKYILSYSENYDVVLPIFNDYPEPLCAYYNKSIVDQLHDSIDKGIYKIQAVVKKLNTKYLLMNSSLPFYNDHMFLNINKENDLQQAERLLKKFSGK